MGLELSFLLLREALNHFSHALVFLLALMLRTHIKK
jgi:hypothetical protein